VQKSETRLLKRQQSLPVAYVLNNRIVTLDKEIWLGGWVQVWEMEVVARKVMREVPREIMIPGMWVLGGVVVEVVGW